MTNVLKMYIQSFK